MNQMLQMRNKFAPNIPKVQCRRMPITVDNLRSVGKSESGNVVISGYAVKWDSINYFGEKFVKGPLLMFVPVLPINLKNSCLLQSWLANVVC